MGNIKEAAMNQNPNQNKNKKNSHEDASSKKQAGKQINLHIILLCAIALTVAFSAYRLYKWNKGVPSDYDPNQQTDAFDVEAMDNIIPLAPDKLEGREDDGITTILCLGDDPFSMNQGEGGLAEQIAKKDRRHRPQRFFYRHHHSGTVRLLQ